MNFHKFACVLLLLLQLVTASVGYSQSVDGVEATLSERKVVLLQLDEDILARKASADQVAVEKLAAHAKSAIARGDVENASDAWKEVLRISPDNASATSFFTTLRILTEIQKELAEEASNSSNVIDRRSVENGDESRQANGRDETKPAVELNERLQDQFEPANLEKIKPATISLEGTGFSVLRLRPKVKMYMNRNQYDWKHIPDGIQNWVFTSGNVGAPPNLNVRVTESGWVFVLLPLQHVYDPQKPGNKELLAKEGWKPIVLASSPFEIYLCLGRQSEKGQVLSVPHFHSFGFSHVIHPSDRVSP